MNRVAMKNGIYRFCRGRGRHLRCFSHSRFRYLSNRVAGNHRQEIRNLVAASTGFVLRETQISAPYKQSAPKTSLTVDHMMSLPGPSHGRCI